MAVAAIAAPTVTNQFARIFRGEKKENDTLFTNATVSLNRAASPGG